MLLCEAVNMRTTVDVPDDLFRKTKVVAALRGTTLKNLVVEALEKEVSSVPSRRAKKAALPLVRLSKGRKLNLEGLDFDDLLA